MATEKRLIDVDKVIEIVKHEADVCNSGFTRNILEYVVVKIENIPTVEVVHGRWVDATHIDEDFGEVESYECSVCGHWDYFNTHNYCPNCGAKMDGDGNG